MKKINGFGLIHIMVSCCIIALLISLSVPGIYHFYHKIKCDTAFAQLQSDLNFARIHAIKSQKPVIICPSLDHQSCSKSWHQSYLIGQWDDNNHFNLIKSGQTKGVTLTLKAALNASQITFKPDGSSQTQGALELTNDHASKKLVIIYSGRIRS